MVLDSVDKRVKFLCDWKGRITEYLSKSDILIYKDHAKSLADALLLQEQHGFSPLLPDGKIGGNGAVKIQLSIGSVLIVSKSGKLPGCMDILNDTCLVLKFSENNWSCEYLAEEESIQPSSDTPMHYVTLNLEQKIKLKEFPRAALHGHGIRSEEAAYKLNIPCSVEETLYSTSADTSALLQLIARNMYPDYKIFVRKNHGYFILGKCIKDCVENSLQKTIIPNI